MRILYLVDTYRPARTACANRSVVLVDALRAAGHDVNVLASTDSMIDAEDGCYSAPQYITFFKTYPLVNKTLVNRLRNNFGGAHEAVKTANTMGTFDVVICSTPPLLLTSAAVKIARKKKAKLVLDVRDVWPDVAYEMNSFTPDSLYGRFFEHIARKSYKVADLVVSVSPGKVKKLKNRIANTRVILVSNGIDTSFIDCEEDLDLIERLRLKEGPICVYVGNIGLAQGLSTILDIASKRHNTRFLLFGDGADKAQLEQRVKTESINNVEFCGKIDGRGVYTVLRYAAISYVPLVSSLLRDSIPTKMYEALACGCPVLLAAEGDAVSLLSESGLGAHAAPEDPSSLLIAFDQLLNNPFSKAERSAASAWVIANHSRQNFAKIFAQEIEKLENGRAR